MRSTEKGQSGVRETGLLCTAHLHDAIYLAFALLGLAGLQKGT